MSAKYNDIDIEFTRKVEKAKLEKNENNAKLTKSLNELNLDKNHKIHNIQISFNEQLASNKAKEASLIHDIEKEKSSKQQRKIRKKTGCATGP